jgi:dienelactone hydrolase
VSAAEIVTFKGVTKTKDGDLLMLTGKLAKPQGEGRFPAVVLLHGCSGSTPREEIWAERLKEWGYVTLAVDSLGPRGETSICGNPMRIMPDTRGKDAHAAKSYLAGLPFVDSNRIAVMGWSHGGWTTLFAVQNPPYSEIKQRTDPFRAAIAFYPYCLAKLQRCAAPLLILIGESDDWCPAERCQKMEKIWMPGDTHQKVSLKVYPGAHHGFDFEGIDTTVSGHRILYNEDAAADSIIQVKNFLGAHMK